MDSFSINHIHFLLTVRLSLSNNRVQKISWNWLILWHQVICQNSQIPGRPEERSSSFVTPLAHFHSAPRGMTPLLPPSPVTLSDMLSVTCSLLNMLDTRSEPKHSCLKFLNSEPCTGKGNHSTETQKLRTCYGWCFLKKHLSISSTQLTGIIQKMMLY